MSQALLYAMQVLTLLPQLMQASAQVKALLEMVNANLATMQKENRDPSPEEWAVLWNQVVTLHKNIQADVVALTPGKPIP